MPLQRCYASRQDLQDVDFQRALKTAQGQRPGLKTALRPTTGARGTTAGQ